MRVSCRTRRLAVASQQSANRNDESRARSYSKPADSFHPFLPLDTAP
jgi:hypothetical protein